MAALARLVQPTPQYTDQKAGTSGLRKPTKAFVTQPNYLENYVQATLTAVAAENGGRAPATLVVGGDGRYFCTDAAQIILRVAAGNGVERVLVAQNALLSTPAASALVRRHPAKPDGAFILTASHNPGGLEHGDFGIKYNGKNGGPAQEALTEKIFAHTKTIKTVALVELPPVDLATLATTTFTVEAAAAAGEPPGAAPKRFEVVVVDPVADYVALTLECFDVEAIKRNLFARPDFSFSFDAMNGIAGPYAQRIFVGCLGAKPESVRNSTPLPDFGGLHPDPNLTYADQLVKIMGLTREGTPRALAADEPADGSGIPCFGAAADGDADRNMVLGRRFFVTPSDSVAVIAANASAIKYFASQGGLRSVARSMPTSAALDRVAAELRLRLFEVPTGWKFFGNLMDSDVLFGQEKLTPLLCGEESFGTGSDHVREKDGIWAVLAWLSILSARNPDPAAPFVSVEAIVKEHWRRFGRNYYARLDYEGVASAGADAMMAHLRALQPGAVAEVAGGDLVPGVAVRAAKVASVDDFCYVDPVDKATSAKQGVRVVFDDGSRYVFRLSGTGASGATIRLYVESYIDKDVVAQLQAALPAMPPTMAVLSRFVQSALVASKLAEFTGRTEPTVIT
jgi:phosphoglucomutase